MTVVASGYARQKNDLYETEEWATEALLRHFPVAGMRVWEPAAGNHKMADVLKKSGADFVLTSDITTYSRTHFEEFDFIHDGENCLYGADAIVTNPPYGPGNRLAVRFAELALERCDGLVALLLTASFDSGKTRTHLFRDCPRFRKKIVLLDRISWTGNGKTGTVDHAWFVWGARGAEAPTIAWEEKQ